MGSRWNSINHLRFLQILVLALIPSFFHHTHKLVSADDNLIETQCHHTETPQLCIECIKSADPKGKYSTDEIGVAITITNCLRNYTEHLAANMKELASGSKNMGLKNAFEGCSKGYTDSLKDLSNVVSCLKRKDFDFANHSVVLATEFHVTCLQKVGKLEGQIPDSTADEMKVYEDLSEGVMRIIDRF